MSDPLPAPGTRNDGTPAALAGVFLFVAALVWASPACSQEPTHENDPHIREILQKALDQALQEQVKQVFAVWMKDPTDQPRRARDGVRRAVKAYRHAQRALTSEKLAAQPVGKPIPPGRL